MAWGSDKWKARREARGRPTDAATIARGPRNPRPRKGPRTAPGRSGGGARRQPGRDNTGLRGPNRGMKRDVRGGANVQPGRTPAKEAKDPRWVGPPVSPPKPGVEWKSSMDELNKGDFRGKLGMGVPEGPGMGGPRWGGPGMAGIGGGLGALSQGFSGGTLPAGQVGPGGFPGFGMGRPGASLNMRGMLGQRQLGSKGGQPPGPGGMAGMNPYQDPFMR